MTAKMDSDNDLDRCENGRIEKDKAKKKKVKREEKNSNGQPKVVCGNENERKTERQGCHRHHSSRSGKAESVISSVSTDSEIRFTRKKLGDNTKCGCVLIAAFLVILLLAATIFYLGYVFLRPETLPNRTFQGRFVITEGERWHPSFADQNSIEFKTSSRDYRERINLVIRKSDLRDSYEGSEILALDGKEENDNLAVLFALYFEPYAALVSAAELHAILMEEIVAPTPKYFANITIDSNSLEVREINRQKLEDFVLGTSSAPLGINSASSKESSETTTEPSAPLWRCEPMKLDYCRHLGYNVTTYPNHLGHNNLQEVMTDVISFREMVDAECFRHAYDFVCRLLQPPCINRSPLDPNPAPICREYCLTFASNCGDRIPDRFRKALDCDKFPESTGVDSCQHSPGCVDSLQEKALSSRLCDGIPDCPDFKDETSCKFCATGSLYCGRGRSCIPHHARCDGKVDCPDGWDEKDCLSITPLVSYLTNPLPKIPHQSRFFSEGYAVFTEKGIAGKICAEGMEKQSFVRKTVAESLCKALGYERVSYSKIMNDTETMNNYVRVLDPKAHEISFVRTPCKSKETLYVSCEQLQCGVQSIARGNSNGVLSKMAQPGDWPWHVALFRAETHVCDGTLISSNWVLTTESCFQGQSKAVWMAVFGTIRLSSTAPWSQRRRVVGMLKSPVEGSTAVLIRLDSPVTFSDFIRPICLPDDDKQHSKQLISRMDSNMDDQFDTAEPRAEKFMNSALSPKHVKSFNENTQYFISSKQNDEDDVVEPLEHFEKYSSGVLIDEDRHEMPRAEALTINDTYYETVDRPQAKPAISFNKEMIQWTGCNTLGWSRQTDQLQRVQLKISDMGACENISIATVNSLCTEAMFHKMDCSEEEYAGSSIVCMMPNTKRWVLVGVASWRITSCASSGVERPRMYDKISSNAEWIRSVITSDGQ